MKGDHSMLILRLGLGILFLAAGLTKLFVAKSSGVTEMLAGIGFPAAAVFAWILIVIEIVGGVFLLIRYQTKIAAWVLAIVVLIAILTVHLKALPALGFFKDLAILAGLVSVALSASVGKKKI